MVDNSILLSDCDRESDALYKDVEEDELLLFESNTETSAKGQEVSNSRSLKLFYEIEVSTAL